MVRITSLAFFVAVLMLANADAILGQQPTGVALDRRIKAQVNDLGTGAKVTVFMKDGTKVRGNISQILDDSFDVTINKERQSSIVSYRDVEKVKRRGWTSGAKIALGVAIGAAAVITVIVIVVSNYGDNLGPFLNPFPAP